MLTLVATLQDSHLNTLRIAQPHQILEPLTQTQRFNLNTQGFFV